VDTWLVTGGVGPALVALPVNWLAAAVADTAKRWFRRLRRTDGLSLIVRAATGTEVGVSDAEFASIRELLEDEQTWVRIGHESVEELAALTAMCLPGRPPGDALVTARAIARGLLEFAARDLNPGLFQQVLLARLARMQVDQATALDEVMLGLHADLAAWFAQVNQGNSERFTVVVSQLARVLEQLPASQADEGQVCLYLAKLIRWLNIDPWPHDFRLGGPVLTPAAIERKLLVADPDHHDERYADELAMLCTRLVIRGGPGSGKTWLAKRAARRCAEAALKSITAGASLDEVELPLYITCSQLVSAPGDIRQAVVSSAFDHFPDLGSARVSAELRMFFAERNAPTLLVIDSLDEAQGPDDRLGQVDSLLPPWRIILTSRRGAWNHQLALDPADQARRVGDLLPMRYPADVEQFIARWFAQQPEWGSDLIAQLASRPALQAASTVPLVLAFYCIIGGAVPLPERRSELFSKVVRRMLTGRWRHSRTDHEPDVEACLRVLREWAWAGTRTDPVSGVGTWADEIPVPGCGLSQASLEALDHVAAPVGLRDIDTGLTSRRFVHRSVREHLVADHMATSMTAEETANELINHLWYDPDWEYAAPAALAMHPQRDLVLTELIGRIASAGSGSELAAIDGSWEVRRFLSRVALESSEDDWSEGSANLITQALADLATRKVS
jgi:hypothetical protein